MLEALLIAIAVFVGALSQRAVGFGIPLFLVPVLLIYFQPPVAMIIFLLVATASNLLVLFAHKEKKEIIWPIIIRLFIAALPGLIGGAFIVTRIDKSVLQIIVGGLVILSICIQEFVFPKPTSRLGVSRGIAWSGLAAGLLNSTVGVSAPALVLWFRTHICTTNQLRHNLAAIFLLMNVVSFISVCISKPAALSSKPLIIFVISLPVALLGNFAGQFIAQRINKRQFEKIILVVVIATGFMSAALGLINLH